MNKRPDGEQQTSDDLCKVCDDESSDDELSDLIDDYYKEYDASPTNEASRRKLATGEYRTGNQESICARVGV